MASESPQQSVFGLRFGDRFGDRHPWLRDALIMSTFIMTAFMKYILGHKGRKVPHFLENASGGELLFMRKLDNLASRTHWW
ncbi:hypothetical protein F5X96DRAFT_673087 [Biscogniauxia mediterranea]|nr:hypothetical protein F5X96DRAFT_673087 [Biscogniauxia mediterranea]